jgi:hypothetical protein
MGDAMIIAGDGDAGRDPALAGERLAPGRGGEGDEEEEDGAEGEAEQGGSLG